MPLLQPMRLFWELASLSFQRLLTYRAAMWAGLATNIFFGLLRAAVLVALYGARQEVSGMSVQDAVTYTGLTQAMIAYLSLFGWYDLMNSVYSGEVAADLLKPFGFFHFWLARDLGRAVAAFLLRGVLLIFIYSIFVEITVPHGAAQWTALLLAIGFSWFVSFGWRFAVNLSAFWTPNAVGIGRFAFGISWVLSGFFMPLRFFPNWFVSVCNATPFPSMVNTPVEIYLGLLGGPAIARALLTQVFWAVILTLTARAIMRAGVRHLVIQGG